MEKESWNVVIFFLLIMGGLATWMFAPEVAQVIGWGSVVVLLLAIGKEEWDSRKG